MNDLIFRFVVALAIGLLVGLERGWRERDEPAGSRTAGIRTYGISALLGAVLAALSMSMGTGLVFAVGFIGFALVFGWFQARAALDENSFSVTSAIVGLCTFALGGLAVAGDYRAAAAGGAALAGILASREVLHQALKRLSWVELRSALVLAAMTAIVLPLLPNRPIDPWNGFNPWEVWFFMVLTATISYVGYLAARMLGPARGFLVSGVLGALVSSMAVTIAFARTANSGGNSLLLAGAASLAALVSLLRVLSIVLILQASLLTMMAPPVLAAAMAFGSCGLLMIARVADRTQSIDTVRNPFELTPLLIFATSFAAVSTASAALLANFGATSLLASSALSGAFDVDVAVLSALRLSSPVMPLVTIAQAVLLAAAANSLGRCTMAILAGPRSYWLPLTAASLLALSAGAVVHFGMRE